METIPKSDRVPHEPPDGGDAGDDVREPPLPGKEGAKDHFPSDADLIDPDEGGGRIKKTSN